MLVLLLLSPVTTTTTSTDSSCNVSDSSSGIYGIIEFLFPCLLFLLYEAPLFHCFIVEKRLEDERRLEEARVGEAAKGEAEELARKAKEFEEAALATMQRSLDERKETERAFLEERIKAMLREELALERSGLEEEVENRRDRRKKYEEMKIAKEQESLSIGAGIGATFGNFVGSAMNTIMATFDPPPVVKSVFSEIRRITGIW